MKQESPESRRTAADRCTCTACPLLCDDILISADGAERACRHGGTAIRASLAQEGARAPAGEPAGALENDHPLAGDEAFTRAADMLASARRVLVAGLANGTLESITAACDLAETLGAAVDAGLPESARPAGPTIARAGEVTAVWEELRDRADLVIFWWCDPNDSHPRFIERFVTPVLPDGRPRRTIAIGTGSVMPDASSHGHLSLARALAVEAARWLQMRLSGRHSTPADAPLFAACGQVEEAIRSAGCVAIVTADADDRVGLEAWSVVHLVRTIAHEKPAFHVPLDGGIHGGGVNAAGAAAVCTWRYGAAGAITRADRMGGSFLPGECDARRLIDRGEVDAVLILGRLSDPLEQAIAERGEGLALVRIGDAEAMAGRPTGRTIRLRCASRTIATVGTMLRQDGRRVSLIPHRQAAVPQMRDLLVELTRAVRHAFAAPDAGGRP